MSWGLLHTDSWPYGPEKPPWICIISQEMVVHIGGTCGSKLPSSFSLRSGPFLHMLPIQQSNGKNLGTCLTPLFPLPSSPCDYNILSISPSSHLFYFLAPRDHHWSKKTLHSPVLAVPLPLADRGLFRVRTLVRKDAGGWGSRHRWDRWYQRLWGLNWGPIKRSIKRMLDWGVLYYWTSREKGGSPTLGPSPRVSPE